MVPTFWNVVPALLLLAVLPFMAAEETYAQKLAKTDLNNAAQVFLLSQWCEAHQQPNKARQHLFQVLKLDRDHAEARAVLGHVKVGERWLTPSQITDSVTKDDTAPDSSLASGGKGPSAAQVAWDVTVPKDPSPENPFVTTYIKRMSGVANDSSEMELSVSTLLIPENLPSGLARLCTALGTPEFTDLYGPAHVVQGLLKAGRRADAQQVFGFLARASSRVTDPDDLQAFCQAAGSLNDKRALPRLLELMASSTPEIAAAASEAASSITRVPRAGLTVDTVGRWWGRFHRLDDAQMLAVQSKSKDPDTAIPAATQLALLGDKAAIEVFIQFMKVEDPKISGKAHAQLTQFVGSDWGFSATDTKENRKKRLDLLVTWWKANKESFQFTIDPRLTKNVAPAAADSPADSPAEDTLAKAVRQLSSANPKAALRAESELLGGGTAAVPFLLSGLSSTDPMTARKCHELLQKVSAKSDIVFNHRDPAEVKNKAIAAWTAWATSENLLPDDGSETERE